MQRAGRLCTDRLRAFPSHGIISANSFNGRQARLVFKIDIRYARTGQVPRVENARRAALLCGLIEPSSFKSTEILGPYSTIGDRSVSRWHRGLPIPKCEICFSGNSNAQNITVFLFARRVGSYEPGPAKAANRSTYSTAP